MNRLEVLRRIDKLYDDNCISCPDKPAITNSYKKCNTTCPVGLELRRLGKYLIEDVVKRRKAEGIKVEREPVGRPEVVFIKYPNVTKELLKREIDAGKYISQIAREHGATRDIVSHRIKLFGLPQPKRGKTGRR